jgi:cephalosporin-C deacetylase-like acetyl esterase
METIVAPFQSTLLSCVCIVAHLTSIQLGLHPAVCSGQSPESLPINLELKSSSKDGIAMIGEPVTVTATVVNATNVPQTVEIKWVVKSIQLTSPPKHHTRLSLAPNQSKETTHTVTLVKPGFAEFECQVIASDPDENVTRRLRFGCEPQKVMSNLTAPKDFNAFWDRGLSELQTIPPAFEVVEHPDKSDSSISVYEVAMRSHGQTRVRGWLEVPKRGQGPFPGILRVPGYGQNMRPLGRCSDMIVFSFNPRGHGNSQQDVPGKPVDYWIRGLDHADSYYYKGAYLDCVRAVDFLASRSDVDQDRLAVWGGSQGGGFALATASLDHRIDYCVADIPFLCDWVNYFRLTDWPEMNGWIAENPTRTWESTLEILSYFDTVNLANRIECPTVMAIGLQDQVCPPTTCFAVFNRIRGDKMHKIYPDKGHGLGREHYEWVWSELREMFGIAPED